MQALALALALPCFMLAEKAGELAPSTTAARLCSEASDHIIQAWKHRELFTGLVIQKTAKGFIPLNLANASLAPALAANGSIWLDLQAVTKELGL